MTATETAVLEERVARELAHRFTASNGTPTHRRLHHDMTCSAQGAGERPGTQLVTPRQAAHVVVALLKGAGLMQFTE